MTRPINSAGPVKPGPSPKADERRKHRRVETPLKGRYLDATGTEKPCLVINISAGGAMLRAKNPPPFGDNIVLYIDRVGRFEARVVRSEAKTFAVNYETRRAKTVRTADALTTVVNAERKPGTTDRRRQPRIDTDTKAVVYLEDGTRADCAILDISLTGASLEISPRPPLGTRLVLGRMKAKVVRRHDKGVGVVFTGTAERMDEVMAKTSVLEPLPDHGPALATVFGKKGADAP